MIKNYFSKPYIFLILLSLVCVFNASGQTTLISPTGDGGFESGATFAANNWTATTGAATRNQWTCNTGATAGFSGLQCAYITNDTGSAPPPHTYSGGNTRVSHLWRTVSVPAGETQITLNFSWIGIGEVSGSFAYDYMRIWVVPTSFTPSYGNQIVASGVAPTGNVSIGLIYASQTTWTNADALTIPSTYAGTSFRLVFEWTNDDTTRNNPPVAVDNISLISLTPPPLTNNDCAGATPLTVNPTTTCTTNTAGTTIGATQSIPALSCASFTGTADDDVWFSFVATSTAHIVTVVGATGFDAVVDVRSGACDGTNINCADATTGGGTETVTVSGLTPGSTYYVRVYSYGSGTNGTFTICVTTPPPPPANDNCSGAVALTVNPSLTCSSTTSGTTVSATQSAAGCAGTADDDVWYSFVATGTSHDIAVAPGTLYDAVFQVYSGTCGGTLTSLACIDGTAGTSNETTTLSGLTPGTTYYVRVYSYYSAASDQGTFSLCVTTPVPLTNDNCATATGLTVNASPSCTVTTSGTTVGATQSQAGCSGTADDDVWYSFVATSATHNVTVTPGTLYDPVFQVFSGSCAGLSSIDCVDDTVGLSVESATISGLTIGNTYFVRVYSYYGVAGDRGTFTICVNTEVSCSNGTSTGTTDLGCPSVISGGLGLSGGDPLPISCTSAGCTDLEAVYLQLGQPTAYTVQSIDYAPPYQYGCLANSVSVNTDDVWSPVINLPFNFCFYGNTYNQCLMSSNGVISFDMTNNTPGGYSDWSFASNLPDNTLFLNSIFGVYQDIDPRVGGEVGWELITLNTGCRALVAAWSNIPMFSTACNSQLYTGMIVLYENTNIIDVFIQEKNVCGTWNSGNAIVGLQNATGTVGSVAPGRNGLDANWTVSNEAWRFVPSGTSITSLKWYEGAGTTGPVIGTTDVINVCPIATTIYTAEVTYTLCNGTTVKETESTTVDVSLSKVWNGSVDTDWNTADNWTPVGVPTNLDCVVIPNVTNDPIISGGAFDAYAYSLRILNDGLLTLNSGNNLTVTNIVNVNAGGTFNIQDDASLLQVDPIANTGIINMQRTTPPVYRFDYTYWNSPMTLSSNYTLGMLSQNLTQYDKYYHWTPSVGGGTGIWAQESVATIMDPANGYIVRAPNNYSFTPTVFTPYTATFTGTPNNGNVSCPISYGVDGSTFNDQWNLIGNPYPCAVNSLAFVTANSAVIDGTLFFWTHNSAISMSFPDPFYNDFVLNYTSSDYAAWNSTGGTAASSGGLPPSNYITAAQSFFVLATGTPGNATFTNAMRVKNNNTQFFRPGSIVSTPVVGADEMQLERHRVWLNLTNNLDAFSQILIGYVETATLNYDGLFDGQTMNQGNVNFYSLAPDHELVIQGRPLPFDVNDQVPLGYKTVTEGEFAIRIDHFDDLFADQNIYIEDKLLNIIHDLKASPYTFTTDAGIFDTRFLLRYTTTALGTGENELALGVTAFVRDEMLHVRSSEAIDEIEIYDVTGKHVKTFDIENNTLFEANFYLAKSVYMAKIKLDNGAIVIRKLLN
jgi:hypothetical protein